MRALLLLVLVPPLMIVSGCDESSTSVATLAPTPAISSTPALELRSRQQAACTATIAAHVNRSIIDISARWLSDEDGIATIETIDGTRRHLCQVDERARVISFSHSQE